MASPRGLSRLTQPSGCERVERALRDAPRDVLRVALGEGEAELDEADARQRRGALIAEELARLPPALSVTETLKGLLLAQPSAAL